jgi:hypothetical protein
MSKICNTCREPKPLSAYASRKASADGLAYTCRSCDGARRKANYLKRHDKELAVRKAWREANLDRSRRIVRAWVAQNPERKAEIDKAWREANKARLNQEKKQYRREHRGWYNSYFKAYKLMRSSRVPSWANSEAIKQVYEQAGELRALGIDVEVDHIVPLNGKTVSGLHVHNNLRVILASDNRAKSNKLVEVA